MPDGVFSNLNSSGIEVGQQFVSHPKVKAVGFTGSIRGGRACLDLAAQRPEPIPVFAEMGSINPVVMLQRTRKKYCLLGRSLRTIDLLSSRAILYATWFNFKFKRGSFHKLH